MRVADEIRASVRTEGHCGARCADQRSCSRRWRSRHDPAGMPEREVLDTLVDGGRAVAEPRARVCVRLVSERQRTGSPTSERRSRRSRRSGRKVRRTDTRASAAVGRRALPLLKTRSPGADDREMGPGDRSAVVRPRAPRDRRAGGASLLAAVPAAATNRGPAPDGSPLDRCERHLDPQTPIVYPTARIRSTAPSIPRSRFSDLDASDGWRRMRSVGGRDEPWIATTPRTTTDVPLPARPDRDAQAARAIGRRGVRAGRGTRCVRSCSRTWMRRAPGTSYAAVAVKHGWIGTENGGALLR
jgi:hypothetical protein